VSVLSPGALLNAAIFAIVGLVLFAVVLSMIEKFMPKLIWTEVIEKQNLAAAVLAGALAIALALIVSSAVH